ncbi:response regulator [Desulfococcus sp.]|uniref:response regulator n=1 Tax=Desulfococcus sp. TaxID=2025834 RepID=UPI00359466D9
MSNDVFQMPEQAEILVVDDSIDSLKLLADLLSGQGYHVRPAANGEMALRSVAESLPDLILLDVKMPVMDGYEVCGRLKADEKTRRIPVLFISGIENIDSKIKCFKAGGVDYITKPFQSEEVLARVRIHLELRQLQLQLERSYSELEERVQERTAELTQAYHALQASEVRFRGLFENSPVSIWELDFSKAKAYLDSLKDQNVDDFEAYLNEHPVTVTQCAEQVALLDINCAAVELFGASDKQALLEELTKAFTAESFELFKHQLLAIWEDEPRMEQDAMVTTLDGEQRYVRINCSVSPGHEKTFSRVLCSLIDITEKKRAEEKIRRQLVELQTWQNMILDREDRVQELKREVNEQLERLGEPIRYSSQQGLP